MKCLRQVVLVATCAVAQTGGEITGVVRESGQAPLIGVRITAIHQSTRSETIIYTDVNGGYRFVGLTPNYYTIAASRSGFQTEIRRDLNLSNGGTLRVDFELAAATSGAWMPPPGTFLYLVIAALIGVTVTESGRKLVQKLWQPIKWLGNKCYEVFAPRFPDWIGLPGYRKRVRRSHLARIENPVGLEDIDVPLEQAFAPLMVLSGNNQERIDLFAFASAHRRMLVLGGPGTGKTTLMKNLVISILDRKCRDELNQLIPVFVVLRDMAREDHSVEQAVISALGKFGFKNANQFIESMLKQGRLLIVLDGLDEVGASRQAIAQRIRDFCQSDEHRHNFLIVTCREQSYRTRDLVDIIPVVTRVEPFSPQHMRVFLQGWPGYKGRTALRLYKELQGDAQILDICRNPLLLTILTGLYLEEDEFNLPTSRNQFYSRAIDELLTHRPARRATSQRFPDFQKMQILQRVALDRLETVSAEEDPEVLLRQRLFEFARQVRGDDLKQSEFDELIEEMVHINGIIKPASDDGYILGHRTFQEYLAAREAIRTRQSEQVLVRFSNRPELSEVLTFYAGLVRNIPEITGILAKMRAEGDLVLAGRCLLNVTELPSTELIEEIVSSLFAAVQIAGGFNPELELLSSLAQRSGQEFDSARQRFSQAVDLLTAGTGATGTAGLVSALSSRPEVAKMLLPALLKHSSPTWRIAAVQLLHDLGTDEGLDQLVELLNQRGEPERSCAAALVADLIQVRGTGILARSEFLPARMDMRLWPFENYFPGRVAIPIVEALASTHHDHLLAVKNRCIHLAVTVKRGKASDKERRSWERFGRDNRLNQTRRVLTRRLRTAWLVLLGVGSAIHVGGYFWLGSQKQIVHVQLFPPAFRTDSRQSRIEAVRAAERLHAEIKRRFPWRATGMARFWPPRNWFREEQLPEDSNWILHELFHMARGERPDDVDWWNELPRGMLALGISSPDVQQVMHAGRSVAAVIPPGSRWTSLIWGPLDNSYYRGWIAFGVISVAPFFLLGMRRFNRLLSRPLRGSSYYFRLFQNEVAISMILFYPTLIVGAIYSTNVLVLVFFLILPISAIWLSEKSEWPRNPFLSWVSELQPDKIIPIVE